MTTTTDLREALASATDFEDAGAIGRTQSVHARIARIRRRRAATGVVAAAVVAAVTVTAIAHPSRHSSVDPATTVVGVSVPKTVVVPPATGFSYRVTSVQTGAVGAASLRATTPAGDDDHVVAMVASGLGDGTATLVDESNTGLDRILGAQTGGAGMGAFVPALGGMTLRIKTSGVTPDVQLALVTYTLVQPLSVGVRDDSNQTAFPEQVGGQTLQTARFARPGQAELTVRTHGDPRSLFFSVYCVVPSSAGDVWMNAKVNGRSSMWGQCDTTPRADASGDGFTVGLPGPANGSVHLWMSHGKNGAPVAIEGAVLGIGVYDVGEKSTTDGIAADRVIESQGRLWQLSGRVWKDGEPAAWRHTFDATQEPRVLRLATGTGGGTTRFEVKGDDGTVAQSLTFGGGAMTGGDVLLLPGTTYTVTVRSERPAKSQILVYGEAATG